MNNLIEIKELKSIGYDNIFCFETWKVSMLSYLPELELENINYVEKHLETDEIFYLLEGKCFLIIGLYEKEEITDFKIVELTKDKLYNVKKNTFHHHILSEDGKVLIVENKNTADTNSKRYELSVTQKKLLEARWRQNR